MPDSDKPITPISAEQPGERYETQEVNVRSVVWSGVALFVGLGILSVMIGGLQFSLSGRLPDFSPANDSELSGPLPPAPQLDSHPEQTLAELRANEQATLHSYGWVAENEGVVNIPIERAMTLIVQRGLPARPEFESAQYQDEAQQRPSDPSSGQRNEEVP